LFLVRNDIFRKIEHYVFSPGIRQRLTFPEDLAAIYWQESYKAFEQCGLSGSVRADDSENVSLLEVKAHTAKSVEAGERFGETVDTEELISIHWDHGVFHLLLIADRDANTTVRVALILRPTNLISLRSS
jgi:hypothetical protein